MKKVILTRIEGQKCPAPSFTGYFLGDLRQYAAGFHFNCDTGQVQAAFQVDNCRKHEDEKIVQVQDHFTQQPSQGLCKLKSFYPGWS